MLLQFLSFKYWSISNIYCYCNSKMPDSCMYPFLSPKSSSIVVDLFLKHWIFKWTLLIWKRILLVLAQKLSGIFRQFLKIHNQRKYFQNSFVVYYLPTWLNTLGLRRIEVSLLWIKKSILLSSLKMLSQIRTNHKAN